MSRLCFFLCLLFLAAVSASGRSVAALVGGWTPIQNLKDPHVVEIGEFAVDEHNKQSQTSLKFDSVVKGETQVVSGTNYRLVLAVKDGVVSEKYQAVVWEKPWAHYRNLTSFEPVKG